MRDDRSTSSFFQEKSLPLRWSPVTLDHQDEATRFGNYLKPEGTLTAVKHGHSKDPILVVTVDVCQARFARLESRPASNYAAL